MGWTKSDRSRILEEGLEVCEAVNYPKALVGVGDGFVFEVPGAGVGYVDGS